MAGCKDCDKEQLLTVEEIALIDLISDVSRSFGTVVGQGPTREHDLREMVYHVHALQNMVLAQAAARRYPHLYRKMGEERAG